MPSASDILQAYEQEMRRGQGTQILQGPVSLEPPFVPFDPIQGQSDRCLAGGILPPTALKNPVYIQIRPSQSADYSTAVAEQLVLSLALNGPASFEVVGEPGKVRIQLVVEMADKISALSFVRSHYAGSEASGGQDLLLTRHELLRLARSYCLRRTHLLPLRTQFPVEPYRTLGGLAGGLAEGEVFIFQVLLVPVKQDWRGNILRMANAPWFPSPSPFLDLPHLPKHAASKVERPLFAVAIRLGASSLELLDRLERCFLPLYDSPENGLVCVKDDYPAQDLMDRVSRSHGMILNASELAGLAHLPDPQEWESRTLDRARFAAPPPELALTDMLVPLGVNVSDGISREVGLSEEWLTRPTAIIGGTGWGKTTLLVRFATLLDKGYGLAFLDPKGDGAEAFLDLVPAHRLNDVVYFNTADTEFPPGLNVLEASTERDRDRLASDLLVAMRRLFESSWGDRLEWILLHAIRTLLASSGEKTLRDLPRLLVNEDYRESVLATVTDSDLQEFWTQVFPRLPGSALQPVLNKVSKLLGRPLVRNIVCQRNRIDFHQLMREGKILVCNLSKGALGEDVATLLGTVILSRLQLAALARPQGQRKLYPIIVDEFHNYAGKGTDTAALRSFFSEARSFRTPLGQHRYAPSPAMPLTSKPTCWRWRSGVWCERCWRTPMW